MTTGLLFRVYKPISHSSFLFIIMLRKSITFFFCVGKLFFTQSCPSRILSFPLIHFKKPQATKKEVRKNERFYLRHDNIYFTKSTPENDIIFFAVVCSGM